MMNSSDSGDHHQAQAAAGRAVVGYPPSSSSSSAAAAAAAAASAIASSPPPPSASDTALQPRARDSGSPDDPPPSNETRGTGGRASGDDDDHSRILDQPAALSDGRIDAVLKAGAGADPPVPLAQLDDSRSNARHAATDIDCPPPAPASTAATVAPSTREQIAAASIENVHQGHDDNDEQIASAHEEMTAVIEDLMNAPLRVNELPLPQPPALTAARYDQMDEDIKALMAIPPNVSEVPRPMAQIAEDLSNMDEAIKQNVKDASKSGSGMDPPLPQSQIAAFAEEMVEDEEEYGSKKKAAPTTEADNDAPPASVLVGLPTAEEEETLQRPQHPPTPAIARAPSPPPTDRGRSPSTPGGQQQLPIRPPPPSMMPSPDEDADPPVPALPRDPSMHMVEATLVEDRQEALVSDLPVYDAVQVPEQTRLEKNKKLIIGMGMVMLVGLSVATGVAVSANRSTSESTTVEPEGVVLSTAHPSASSRPSQIPSHPPSSMPTPIPSSRPSQIPSHRPSSMPTPAPPLYCAEINILTDCCYWQTSWQIRNTVTVNGISYPNKLVLEGGPEERGHYTYEACLERGHYEFAIFDSVDGIGSPGYFNVTFDGQMIAQGREIGSEERVSFSLPIWNRQGLGFNGDASDDSFGEAVAFSADASTMAIGAPGWLGSDNSPGYVKVYRREGEGSSWEQRGDTIHGEANGDYSGWSLSLSQDGTTLSIGAPFHDSTGPDSGQVKVYEWAEAASNYVQIGDTLYGAASGDGFGHSLDISSGKTLAVGAYASDANGSDSGQVTIYAWDDASSNFKQRREAIDGDAAGGWFGYSVSLSENGQKLAVGAPLNDSNGINSGQVKVFEWDDAISNYEQMGDSLLGDAARDEFGWSLSFSRDGTTLAIGAPYNDENGRSSGQVKVFAWDEAASNFEQIGQSLYGKAADQLGYSVVLSSEGKTLAVGAPYDSQSGYAEVYRWDEAASEYRRLGQILDGEASNDQFGFAFALAGNGRDLAVGAPRNDRNGTGSGRVEVFHIEL